MELSKKYPIQEEPNGKLNQRAKIMRELSNTVIFTGKSVYYNLRTNRRFLFSISLIAIPIFGVFWNWNASDFLLVTFLNILSSFFCLWIVMPLGGYHDSFISRIKMCFVFFLFFIFFFLLAPMVGMKQLIGSPSQLNCTITFRESMFILLAETAFQFLPITISWLRKNQKKDIIIPNPGKIFIDYVLLIPPATVIFYFLTSYPELYKNHQTLFDFLLSFILLLIIILGENFAELPVFAKSKKAKMRKDKWFEGFDAFYRK